MSVIYFGCWGGPGHYPWGPGQRSLPLSTLERLPWGYGVDSGLCPKKDETQGRALLHHKGGWTALAFWDRSVDTRPGSNSAFLADGDFNFDAMVEKAKASFPQVWERFPFEVVPASASAPRGQADKAVPIVLIVFCFLAALGIARFGPLLLGVR